MFSNVIKYVWCVGMCDMALVAKEGAKGWLPREAPPAPKSDPPLAKAEGDAAVNVTVITLPEITFLSGETCWVSSFVFKRRGM